MTFFKIRHKPSGLFYRPSKYDAKTNLSKVGKTYSRKPTIAGLQGVYNHPLPKEDWRERYELRKVISEEWEVLLFNTSL